MSSILEEIMMAVANSGLGGVNIIVVEAPVKEDVEEKEDPFEAEFEGFALGGGGGGGGPSESMLFGAATDDPTII